VGTALKSPVIRVNDGIPNPKAVKSELARILNSRQFAEAPRLQAFLEFAIGQALDGNYDRLKEIGIAIDVFGKPHDFNPGLDSTVRAAANRLRAKLRAYYRGQGRHDSLVISLPKGHYIPTFTERIVNRTQKSQRLGVVHAIPQTSKRRENKPPRRAVSSAWEPHTEPHQPEAPCRRRPRPAS
jgi:hypothetical protein